MIPPRNSQQNLKPFSNSCHAPSLKASRIWDSIAIKSLSLSPITALSIQFVHLHFLLDCLTSLISPLSQSTTITLYCLLLLVLLSPELLLLSVILNSIGWTCLSSSGSPNTSFYSLIQASSLSEKSISFRFQATPALLDNTPLLLETPDYIFSNQPQFYCYNQSSCSSVDVFYKQDLKMAGVGPYYSVFLQQSHSLIPNLLLNICLIPLFLFLSIKIVLLDSLD